jgi:hypothetical protein
MENLPVITLLEALLEDEVRHIEDLVQAKEHERQAVDKNSSTESMLGQSAGKMREVIFEQYYKKRRSPILTRLLGHKALKVHYGNEQNANEMGFGENRSVLNVPYVETLPLLTTELAPFEGFEGYKFSQGWLFRVQVGMAAKLKTPGKYLSAKIEPYILDVPLGIHTAVTEHVTGRSTNELRYQVSDQSGLTVFHAGKPELLLGQASDIQLGVLGLMNKAIDELAS